MPCAAGPCTAAFRVVALAGLATPPLLAALPLPVYTAWARLYQQACKLGVPMVPKLALDPLLDHFVTFTDARPVWEANPMDALALRADHARCASAPLLRALACALFAHAQRQLASLPDALPRALNESAVHAQTQRLVQAKFVLIGMEVCAWLELLFTSLPLLSPCI